jgi:hypothetical protein
MSDRWDSELFSDKNFGDLFAKSSEIASSRFNRNFAVATFNLTSLVLLAVAFLHPTAMTGESVAKASSQFTNISFSFATSILGFLVTGFSIFATIISPETLKLLSISRYRKNNKFSNIQFIMYNFMYVFFYYISSLVFFLSMTFLTSEYSPIIFRRLFSFIKDEYFFVYAHGLLLCFSFALMTYLIMLLKSFVWNIYQSVLLIAAARALYLEHTEENRD